MLRLATNTNFTQVTLAWDSNTEPDLGGYRRYYGAESNHCISNRY
jgi:hypothetical protein